MIKVLTDRLFRQFEEQLREEEKSSATIEKYIRDVKAFRKYLKGEPLTKSLTIAYKNELIAKGYAPASINSMLASIHKLFSFLGRQDCCVKTIKIQRQAYCPAERELTKDEYLRLLRAAERKPRLSLLLQTIGSTGVRVSELKYFTIEAVRKGTVTVTCKNKTRTVLLSSKLQKKLLGYAKRFNITEGVIFRTRSGKPLDRSNIWSEMKKLCALACVSPEKVFPHNLRKLFARAFYQIKRDLAKLADILGHSTLSTTQIYLISSGREHRRLIERLGFVT